MKLVPFCTNLSQLFLDTLSMAPTCPDKAKDNHVDGDIKVGQRFQIFTQKTFNSELLAEVDASIPTVTQQPFYYYFKPLAKSMVACKWLISNSFY